jgi:hypothetical protein
MKIQGTPVLHQAERIQRPAARPAVESVERAAPAEEVRLEGGAKFIAEVRADAATLSEVRAHEVIRAREDIATGQLMTDAEVEAAVDGLLAGL